MLEKNVNRLKCDPLDYLLKYDTVFGLAAQSSLQNFDCKAVTNAQNFRFGSQSKDGSWNGSVKDTIVNLYELWVLGTKGVSQIERALNWLLEFEKTPLQFMCKDGAPYSNLLFKTFGDDNVALQKMKETPFTRGCSGFIKTGATLSLCTQFETGDPDRILKAYQSLVTVAAVRKGKWCSMSCSNNIFQAFAVHPYFSKHLVMDSVLLNLKQLKDERRAWNVSIPFYPLFHGLSYIDHPLADELFHYSLQKVFRTQNKNGSWGRTAVSFKTYLVYSALKRKNVL